MDGDGKQNWCFMVSKLRLHGTMQQGLCFYTYVISKILLQTRYKIGPSDFQKSWIRPNIGRFTEFKVSTNFSLVRSSIKFQKVILH